MHEGAMQCRCVTRSPRLSLAIKKTPSHPLAFDSVKLTARHPEGAPPASPVHRLHHGLAPAGCALTLHPLTHQPQLQHAAQPQTAPPQIAPRHAARPGSPQRRPHQCRPRAHAGCHRPCPRSVVQWTAVAAVRQAQVLPCCFSHRCCLRRRCSPQALARFPLPPAAGAGARGSRTTTLCSAAALMRRGHDPLLMWTPPMHPSQSPVMLAA